MINYREKIACELQKHMEGLKSEEILNQISVPPDSSMGDYAFPAFPLAKIMKKSPVMIAEELAGKIEMEEVEKIETRGGYLNFFLNRKYLAEMVLTEVMERGEDYGKSQMGKGKTVTFDYSSPNIAKPFHIGHIRSTVIGDSLKRIYDFLGYETVGINHLGDYGTQFGMMIHAYNLWGDPEVIEKNPIPELVKLYVRINSEGEEDESLKDESREWFKRLENKDPEAMALWEWFREISLKDFKRVYDLLDIEFDSYQGESFYSDYIPAVIEELKEKNLLIEDQGALIVDLSEYDLPPALIIKKDGTTIYLTRDLATAIYRKNTYDFYKNLYVVGSQQNLHFKQLFAVLDKMGYGWSEDCEFVPFGMVSLNEGTLSTRRGNVIYLEDVLNKATEKVDDILKAREKEQNRVMENREELARQVGIGAVKFQELFNQRIKDYVFDWDKTLSFEGETGPYVQYTHARIHSLLEKGHFDPRGEVDFSRLSENQEIELIKLLYGYTDVVIEAQNKNEPYIVTRHLVETAKTFNKYYNSTTIITDDEILKNTRLALAYGVKNLLKSGLYLLGIHAPNKM